MDPATLAALQKAYKAVKMLRALKRANGSNGQQGGNKLLLYLALAVVILSPILFVLVQVLAAFGVIFQLVGASSHIPGLKTAAKAASDIGCFFGNDTACKLKDILDAADDLGIQDAIKESVDCHNLPTDTDQSWCDPNAMNMSEGGPIPQEQQWEVPVYIAAANHYNIPWQLIAAVHGARTNFSKESNCEGQGGPLDIPQKEWDYYKVDAGTEAVHKKDKCYTHNAIDVYVDGDKTYTDPHKGATQRTIDWVPADHIDENPGDEANQYDTVDQIFTEARILAANGAKDNYTWQYTGSPCGICKPDTNIDGTTYPYTAGGDVSGGGQGNLGGNPNLTLPDDILTLGQLYSFADWEQETFPATPGHVPGELTCSTDSRTIPRAAEKKIFEAVGQSLNIPQEVLDQVQPYFFTLIQGESGFRPALPQCDIGDVNDAYPKKARGLVQFAPGTFWSHRVPGYDNVFNPVHNTLAAMNTMLYATSMACTRGCYHAKYKGHNYGIWPMGSGWSPGGNTSPFNQGTSSGGSSAPVVQSGPYNGKPINYNTDPVARAVQWKLKNNAKCDTSDGGLPECDAKYVGEHSDGYVALVHDWFVGISTASSATGDDSGGGGATTFAGTFVWPTNPRGFIVRGWGGGTNTGGNYHRHAGIDIGVPVGSDLIAAAAGVVVESPGIGPDAILTPQDPGGYGCYITIKHANNVFTRYGHASGSNVKIGDKVTQGEVIGKSGGAAGGRCSGDAQGPHLHFELRSAQDFGFSTTSDPLKALPKS